VKSDCLNPFNNFMLTKHHKKADGFTLLEVLISISLLMVVIALAGMAMRMGFNSVVSGEKKIEKMERFRSSLQIISSQMGSEIPLLEESSQTKKFRFQGAKNALQISTGYSIWDGIRGYVVVEYQIVEDEKGFKSMKALERSIATGKKMETLLFSGMGDISFEYPGKKDITTGEKKWLEEWGDNKTMPEKVKLNLEYEGEKYSFIMPLRAQNNTK